MKRNVAVAVSLCAACLSLSAHDDDTLAFYSFKEGAAGDSLAGETILNAADDRFHGTVSIGSGAVSYSADTPGAYVFSAETYGAAVICENPGAVRFSGNSTEGSQFISFPDIGTTVSSNEDFTVEFFFKYPEGDGGANKTVPVLAMNCGLHYNPADTTKEGAGEPGLFGIMIHGNPDRYVDGYIVDRNHHKARVDTNGGQYPDVCLDDGLWHHVAVVYSVSAKKYTVYLDYGTKKTEVTKETAKSVLDVPEEMLLGNGGFRGLVSCLRVSKCARTVETFLRASRLPTCFPETVFHWSFDDAEGIADGVLASPLSADPRRGQFIAKHAPRDGIGAVNGFQNGEVAVVPVCTNEIPVNRCVAVMSAGNQLAESSNSVSMTMMRVGTGSEGTGLRVPGTDYFPVTGSFTMEGWFKMDYETWKTMVVDGGLDVQRVALMGLNYGGGYTTSDFALTMVYQSDGFRLKLCVNQSDKQYDPTGVNLHEVCRDGKWHHFAVVYDESDLSFKAYVDGAEKISFNIDASFEARSSEPYREYLVGWGLAARQYAGLADEIRLVRKALDPSEFISFDRRKTGMVFTLK